MLRNALVFVLCGLSAACGVSSTATENQSSAQVPSKPVHPLAQEADASPQSTSKKGAAKGANASSKQCGGAEMTLSCDGVDAECTQTSLKLSGVNGNITEIINPKSWQITRASVWDASLQKNNIHYFVVQYGELPYGCEFCEWFHLYDAQGRQLTRSDPPILIDSTLPAGKQQVPNDREFDKLSKELGLDKPHVEFLN